MGAAERIESEPAIELDGWELELGETTDPWCVDDGRGIAVMRTRAIRDGLSAGSVSPEHKVWRDGRACWVRAGDVHELAHEPEDVPAQSRIRRITRTTMALVEEHPAPGWWRRTLMMVFGGVLVGLLTIVYMLPDSHRTDPPIETAQASSRVASR